MGVGVPLRSKEDHLEEYTPIEGTGIPLSQIPILDGIRSRTNGDVSIDVAFDGIAVDYGWLFVILALRW